MNHIAIPISGDPCFFGTRVAAYGKAIQLRRHILSIQNSVGHGYNIELDRDVLPNYAAYTQGEAAISFFNSVSKFQQEAVCDWNRTRDDVTFSYNMRFVGVRKDSLDGAATVILDMLLNFGVLVYNQDETWALSRTARFCRLYCFGDRKTIKNGTAFVNKRINCSLSFEQSSLQAENFLNAFSRVMFLPGDWHTGMNMLQSIYKLFWVDPLKPFRDLLKWKRISMDVRKCYFQASCFVQYWNDVILSYLIWLYLHRYHDRYDAMMSDEQTVNVLKTDLK